MNLESLMQETVVYAILWSAPDPRRDVRGNLVFEIYAPIVLCHDVGMRGLAAVRFQSDKDGRPESIVILDLARRICISIRTSP